MRKATGSLVPWLALAAVVACGSADRKLYVDDLDASVEAGSGGSIGSGGSGAGGTPATGGSPSGGSGGTPVTEMGTLTLEVNLPEGVEANVTVTGPGGARTVTESGSLSVAPGTYAIAVRGVREAGTFVDTLWSGSADVESVEVEANETATVTVTYTRRPGSGHVWVANGQDHTLVAYSDATLSGRGSGGDAGADAGDASALDAGNGGDAGAAFGPDIVLSNPTADGGTVQHLFYPAGIAFDGDGNLWVGNCSHGKLLRYAVEDLGATGTPNPSLTIETDECLLDLAFDQDGRLAVATTSVLVFPPAELTESGAPITIGSDVLVGPEGVAFDEDGNLWVADYFLNAVLRWDAADIAGATPGDAGGPAPSQTWTGLEGAVAVTFDPASNLWVTNYEANEFVRVASANLNSADLVVSLRLGGGGAVLGPETPAFDGAGNLWVPDWAGDTLVQIAASDLAKSSGDAGAVAVESFTRFEDPRLDSPYKVALNPPPATVPIFTP